MRLIVSIILFYFTIHCLDAENIVPYSERTDSAYIYISRNKWEDAERVIKDALRIEPANPGNCMLISNLGVIQSNLGKYDEAIESFDIALTSAPNSSAILENRADALIKAGRTSEAYSDLDKALTLAPEISRIRKLHGYLALSLRDISIAEKDFEILINTHPDDLDAICGLAECKDLKGNIDKAIELYSDAIKLKPDADKYFSRAWLYIRANNFINAENDIREALKLEPRDGNIYLLRAYLNHLRYRTEDARLDKKLALEYGVDPQLLSLLFPEN